MSEDDREQNVRNMREKLKETEKALRETEEEMEALRAERRLQDIQGILAAEGYSPKMAKLYDGPVSKDDILEWAYDIVGDPQSTTGPQISPEQADARDRLNRLVSFQGPEGL